jgi:hypothetical protein
MSGRAVVSRRGLLADVTMRAFTKAAGPFRSPFPLVSSWTRQRQLELAMPIDNEQSLCLELARKGDVMSTGFRFVWGIMIAQFFGLTVSTTASPPQTLPPTKVDYRRDNMHSGDLSLTRTPAVSPSGPAAQAVAARIDEPPSYRWVPVNLQAEFAPRDGAGALVFQGRMWLIGGWNPGDKRHFPRICNNEVWSSADGRAWRLEKPNTFLDETFDPQSDWEGRHTAGYAVLQNKMWIIGGDVNQGHYQHDVWNSPDGRTWTLVNPDQPVPWGPRALHYTVAFRDRLWVIGGQTMPGFAPSEEKFYRDVWTSRDGKDWEQVLPEDPAWAPRGMIGGQAVFRDRIWLLGGGTYDTPSTPTRNFFNDVWSSADGRHWELHTESAPWTARQYHEVAVFDDRLWVLEGYAESNRNDVWHSADGITWHEVPNTPWKPRHAASVFVHDNALWMVAGNNMESDVWRLVKDPPPR